MTWKARTRAIPKAGTSLLLRNGRPLGKAPTGNSRTDVLVTDGVIVAIGPNLVAPPGTPIEDAGGALVLPGFVEAHTHLDKSLWSVDWHPNDAGPSLLDKIDNECKPSAS